MLIINEIALSTKAIRIIFTNATNTIKRRLYLNVYYENIS